MSVGLRRAVRRYGRRLAGPLALAVAFGTLLVHAQIPGRNVNMVSGTSWPDGDPHLQRQNEPSIAASTRNPLHLLAGSNDYRTVDLPGLPDGGETGDAWLSYFTSTDGGQRWKSTLIPGYPQDPNLSASPLRFYKAAADPVVRAGTNGLLYYAGLAFNRGANGSSAVFMARFIDNNNNEHGDPIALAGVRVVASAPATAPGTIGGSFLDKPWIAVDIPRGNAPTCQIQTPGKNGQPPLVQRVPAGAVYVVYSSFSGEGATLKSDIMFSYSANCGVTWSTPVRLNAADGSINQGATIAIEPHTGLVTVAWRRFTRAGSKETDGIMVANSVNFGRTFLSAITARRLPRHSKLAVLIKRIGEHRLSKGGIQIEELAEFDQGTSAEDLSFRTNAYPTMTWDDRGRLYLAWAERGFSVLRNSPVDGDARIVMSTALAGLFWGQPRVVSEDDTPGHQFMPSLAFAGGKLMLVYYDLRDDVTGLTTKFIDDKTAAAFTGKRHTMDIRASMGTPGAAPVFAPSVRVSDYLIGRRPVPRADSPKYPCGLFGQLECEQLQFNPPNLPMFQLGTAPFVGDYIDISAAPAFVPAGKGKWAYNTSKSTVPIFHAVWTDNRDVRPPVGGDWRVYGPPVFGTLPDGRSSLFDPTQTVVCDAGSSGSRNQNIYTARIAGGLLVGSPGNTKPLSATLQRGFVVFAQNMTTLTKTFRMRIVSQPPGGRASFTQLGPVVPFLDVVTPPRSMASRTVYVTSTDPKAQLEVQVAEIRSLTDPTSPPGALTGDIILNADIENPLITADIENADIENQEITTADIENPTINADIENSAARSADIENADIENADIENADIENADIENADIENADIENADIENASLTDVTWKVTNTGNTTTAFNVNLFLSQQSIPGVKMQLILHKVYTTPTTVSCELKLRSHNVLVANITRPTFLDPTSTLPDQNRPDASNGTMWLAPGETGRFTLRIRDKSQDKVAVPDGKGGTAFINRALVPGETLDAVVIPQEIGTVAVQGGATKPPVITPDGSTLFFAEQPVSTIVGQAIPVTVQVRDTTGTVLPGAAVQLSLVGGPEGSSLIGGGPALTGLDGVASFSVLVSPIGTGYRLQASVTGFTPALSAFFAILQTPVASFTVTNTSASGAGSLRQAILNANASPGADTIAFAIPGEGVRQILAAGLPAITDPVTIDGTTQSGFVAGTPIIELNGTGSGAGTDGLVINAGASVVRGLIINRYSGSGIVLQGGDSNVIAGNWIGTAADGATPAGNGNGILVLSSGNAIGGPSPADMNVISGNTNGVQIGAAALGNVVQGNVIGTDRTGAVDVGNLQAGVLILGEANAVGGSEAGAWNLISGNDEAGIRLGGGAAANSVQGNFIGTDISGLNPLPNLVGVSVGMGGTSTASSNMIGGLVSSAANVIAFNAAAGVLVQDGGTNNAILGNSIHSNGALGIDLNADGVTANDAGDADNGANDLTNFPVLTASAGGVQGTLNSTPDSTFRIEYFGNAACDASGYGEGAIFLGSTEVTTDGTGTATIPLFTAAVGQFLTATATDPSNNTSEFSACVLIPAPTADLALTKEDSPDPVSVGSPLTYTLTVTNNGPDSAESVTVTDTLPAGVSFVSATPSQGTCVGTVPVTCSLNTLTGGAVATVSIVVTPNAPGAVNNTAAVTSTTNDPNPENNGAIVSTTVLNVAQTFVVTNTADGGAGSLRAAMTAANADPITADTITFNILGTAPFTIAPVSPLPVLTGPVSIDGASQPGFTTVPVIEINGAGAGANAFGLRLDAGNSVVRGLVINRFGGSGIEIVSGGSNLISGNYIGTDVTGTLARPNGSGLTVSSSGNTIGGQDAALRNVIAGNQSTGVNFTGGSANVVQGNYIGLDVTGTAPLGNGAFGISIFASQSNVIGGTAAGAGNVVAASTSINISIQGASDNNTIQGNRIGTNAAGTAVVGPNQNGVYLIGSSNNLIGGTVPGARNVVSGSSGTGQIVLGVGSSANTVEGNYIGTNAAGDAALPNGTWGVQLGGPNNVIGGATPGAGNLISGNDAGGVVFFGAATGNSVHGNLIGTAADGVTPVPNQSYGIGIQGPSGNTIGTQGSPNVIAFNTGAGVAVSAGTQNAIVGNSISSNGGLGIDLGPAGVTPNDPGDTDAGANDLLNFPVLSSARTVGSNVRVQVDLSPTPSGPFQVHFYLNTACDASGAGEGASLIGVSSFGVNPGGDTRFEAVFPVSLVPAGSYLTATATDSGNNTSEFSLCEQVDATAGTANLAITKSDSPDPVTVGTDLTYLMAVSNSGPDAGSAVVVTDVLPAGVTFVSASSSIGSCTGTSTVTCTLGSLASGSLVTVSIVVRPTATGLLSNTATVSGSGTDPDGANNSATTTTTVNPVAPSTFVVTNTNDAGAGSLRAAIAAANAELTSADTIAFNIPGTGPFTIAPTSALPTLTGPVTIDGTTQPGFTTVPIIEISGANAGAGANGLALNGANSLVRGLAINRFSGSGIRVGGSGTRIEGNLIGTTVSGTSAAGNGTGITIQTTGATVGGLTLTETTRNVISGNLGSGLTIQNSTSSGNLVVGNYIGTDITGTAALPNLGVQSGVFILNAPGNVIGGTAAGAGNVISGNAQHALTIVGATATGNLVQGNRIGTAANGIAPLGNAGIGIDIVSAPGNTIGGFGSAHNVVANNGTGIQIRTNADGNVVRNNAITSNGGPGVRIEDTSGNTVGGTGAVDGNFIQGNGAGIVVLTATSAGNAILGNSISGNTFLGIDLNQDGVTANDAGDADSGPNGRQNFPVLTAASGGVQGTLNSTPNTTFRIEFFGNTACDTSGNGEGAVVLGAASVTTDGTGNATIPLFAATTGQFVTATATDASNNTSEFSACVQAGASTLRTWISDADGFWEDPQNWSGGIVPANGDDVVIDRPGANPIVTVESAVVSLASLRSEEPLVVMAGSMNFEGPADLDGGLTLAGGVLSGPGSLTLGGVSLWTSGHIAGTGAMTVLGGASLAVSSPGAGGSLVRSITNHGLLTWNQGSLSLGGATIANHVGGVFEVQDNFPIVGGTITNAGTFLKSGPTGTLTLSGVAFTSIGTIQLRLGTESDRIVSDSPGTLGGVLDVRLVQGFTPTNGQLFDVLSFGTRIGAFATINGNGETYTPSYSPAGLTLIAGSGGTADLSLSNNDAPDPATTGSGLTYGLTITNNGPGTAASVTVTDTLPGTVTFVSATASQGSCSGTTTVICGLGALASGTAATVIVVVIPTVAGAITNTATVISTSDDPLAGNNTATAQTTVVNPGQTFVVTNTADDGSGSLRQAIQDANANTWAIDIIRFDIPGPGPHTITPASLLPVITEAVNIDATTQPGYAGLPLIELDGTNAGPTAVGLFISGHAGTMVRGLAINRFGTEGQPADAGGAGIVVQDGGTTIVQNNFIGTDPTGTIARPNRADGIFIGGNSPNNVIGGGTDAGNVISGNGRNGITLNGTGTTVTIVSGNLIGTDRTGTVALGNVDGVVIFGAPANIIGTGDGNVISGNQQSGITISQDTARFNYVANNVIGANSATTGPLGNGTHGVVITGSAGDNVVGANPTFSSNIVAFNAQSGIRVLSGVNNAIEANAIFQNGLLGIDIGGAGVTANDSGDTDAGANNLQNFPVLSITTGGVQVTLNSTPNTGFTIWLFGNTSCDPSGNGEGARPLSTIVFSTDGTGTAFATFPAPAGQFITATATDPLGNTSELSNCQESFGDNQPPTANAGPNQTVPLSGVVQLDGSASSDPDDDDLTFTWILNTRPAGSNATLSATNIANPTFVADVAGTYVAQLVVNDGQINSESDIVTITTQNAAPVANAGPDQSDIAINATVNLNGAASSDPDDNPITYAWSLVLRPGGSEAVLFNPTTVAPSFVADRSGRYRAELVVSDGLLTSVADTVDITTVNQAPTANAGPDQSVAVAATVHLTGGGSTDPDNNPLTYAWTFVSRPTGSAAALTNANTASPTFVADVAGTFVVRLVVNDTIVDSAPDEVTITATPNTIALALVNTNLLGVGRTATVRITLPAPSPGGSVVVVTSDNTNVVTVGPPNTIDIPAGGTTGDLVVNGINPGTTTVRANATGYIEGTLTVTTTQNVLTVPATLNVPFGGTASFPVNIATAAPAGGVTVALISTAPGNVEVLTATVTIPQGAVSANGTLRGAGIGNATVTASHAEFSSASSLVSSTGALNIIETSATLRPAFPTTITIRLQSGGNPIAAPAGGLSVTLTPANAACLAPESPVLIPAGLVTITADLNYGGSATLPCTTTLTASAPNLTTDVINVTVNPNPGISLFSLPMTVGAGLQDAGYTARLGEANHGGVTMRIESSDPTLVRVAPNATTPGTAFIEVAVLNGVTDVQYTIQGIEGGPVPSSVTLTATATGFTGSTGTANVVQPALRIENLSTTTTSLSVDQPFHVRVGTPTAGNANLGAIQAVRPGHSVIATVTNGTASVARLTTTAGSAQSRDVTIGPNQSFSPTSVATGGVAFDPIAGGTTAVSASIPGFIATTAATVNVTVSTPGIQLFSLPATVGAGLQDVGYTARLGGSAHGGVTMRIESSDPALVRVAPNATTPGTAFIDVVVPNNQTDVQYSIQGIEGAAVPSSVTLTASAPGFTNGTGTVNLVQPALRIENLPTTTTSLSADQPFHVRVGTPTAGNTNLGAIQALRPGHSVIATVTNGTASVARLTTTAGSVQSHDVTIGPNQSFSPTTVATGGVAFDPIGGGTTTVSASIPGFITTPAASVTVTVNAPGIQLFSLPATVGAGLQDVGYTVRLGGSAHGGVTVRIESSDPALVRVAPNATTAGTAFIDVFVPNNQTDAQYSIQGIEGAPVPGSVTLTATAPGFTNATGTVNLVQPALRIENLSTTTTSLSVDQPFHVRVGTPTAGNANLGAIQTLRAGYSVIATVTNGTPGVARLTTTGGSAQSRDVTIGPNQSFSPTTVATGGVAFDPIGGGTTTVSASIPGFITTTAASVTVTVSAPAIQLFSLPATVGAGLQDGGFTVRLGGSAHGGVTIRISSSNASVVRVSPNATTPGTAFVDLAVANNQTDASYFLQGVEGASGTVIITASAPGFTDQTGSVTTVQPALRIENLGTSTTLLSTDQPFHVRIGIPTAGNTNLGAIQTVRAGSSVTATVMNGTPSVARLTTTAGSAQARDVTIGANQSFSPTTVATGGVAFDPIGNGTTTVSASIPGFITTTAGSVDVTVSTPGIQLFSLPITLGAGLQDGAYTVRLGGSAHGGVTVRIESADPSRVRVAPNGTTPGTAFIDLLVPDNQTDASYFIQAIEGASVPAAVTLTATAPGFSNATGTVNVVQPALRIESLPTSVSATGAVQDFYIRVGIPTADATNLSQIFNVRAGTTLTVTVTNSNENAAQLVTLSGGAQSRTAVIPANQAFTPTTVASGGVGFDPLQAGTTTVTASIPGFISTLAASVTIQVTGGEPDLVASGASSLAMPGRPEGLRYRVLLLNSQVR